MAISKGSEFPVPEEVMRLSAVVISALVFSTGASLAQTGFSRQTYSAVLPPSSDNNKLLSADLNGDGRADLVAYGSRYPYGGQNAPPGNVFLDNGHGGFLAPVALQGVLPMAAAAIGDVNGDGRPDIVGCANTGSDMGPQAYLFVYLNKGDGTFNYYAQGYLNTQCSGLSLGDVYQNGRMDVVTAGSLTAADGIVINHLDVFSNDGRGNFTLAQSTSPKLDDQTTSSSFTNCGLIDVVGGDFLQHNQFDLVLTTQCRPKGQNPPGQEGTTFLSPEEPTGSSGGLYTTFTHLDSGAEIYTQGHPFRANPYASLDAMFLGSGTSVVNARNLGSGGFQFNFLYHDSQVDGSYFADFNGDGFNDLAIAHDPNSSNSGPAGPPMMAILNGTQNGNYVIAQDFAIGTFTQIGGGVATGDFDGDGKADIATLAYDLTTRATSLVVLTNIQSSGSTTCVDSSTTTPNVICSPANESTVTSPVTVQAASNIRNFTLNRLYLDNKAVYQVASQTVDTPIDASAGSHRLVLVTYDSQGHAYSSATTFTVGSGGMCYASSSGVTICTPAAGSSDASPITISAAAMASSGNITAIRAYIDNVAVFTVNNPSATKTFSASQSVNVAAGTHTLVVLGYQSTGGQVSNSESFTATGGPCYPSAAGAMICSPKSGSTVSSPVSVVAGVTTLNGYVAAIRMYVDNVAKALVNNPQQTKSFQIQQPVSTAAGSHSLVIVGYPSTGGSITVSETFTVQ